MPKLVAIDVSVTGGRITLAFSDRAVAAFYAAYLTALDRRPAQYQPAIPGYRRSPQLHAAAKAVSLSLPDFITWFITCRLPDDEDSVTLSFADAAEPYADRWAASMVVFERLAPAPRPTDEPSAKQLHVRRLWNRTLLLKRLDDELRGRATAAAAATTPPTTRASANADLGGRAGAAGPGGGNSPAFAGGRGVPRSLPLVAVPGGRVQARADIWW